MPNVVSRSGLQTLLRLLAVVAAIGALAGCLNPQQADAFDRVNAERGSRGIHKLYEDPSATEKAQAWADHLAATGKLAHSHLPSGIAPGYTALGEIVGVGDSIAQVHQTYMGSSSHRAKILDRRWTTAGVGVAESGGRVYTVVVFVAR